MGYSTRAHLVYGWKLTELKNKDGEEINVFEDEFLPYVEGHRGIKETIIQDQMLGNYIVFGIPLGSVDDCGDFYDVGEPELNSFGLRNRFKEIFGIDSPAEEPTILLFMHCD